MVAVVTGAAGFIGRVLVGMLAERGPVIGVDRLPMPPRPGVTALQADLLGGEAPVRDELRDALAAADAVFHLAGCPDVRDARPDARRHRHRDNVLATAAVLAAVPRRTPLLVTSSSSVYGGTRTGRPSAETDRLRPRGGYARSKLAVERLCAARHQDGGRITVVRPFTVAGEGQRPGMALAQWIAAARDGHPLRLLGHPDRSRDLTDVAQAARAMVELTAVQATGVVNIGTGVGHSLRELTTAVCSVLDVDADIVLAPAHPAEVTHTLADTTALRGLVGWAPRTDLLALIARQAAAASAVDSPRVPSHPTAAAPVSP